MSKEKKELQIVETEELTQEEKTELGANIDRLIEAHKNNRQTINRLVFESVAAMTEADDAATTLSRKGTLSRWVGGITGSNQKLQNTINKNRSAAQYAAQLTLQKLAEQNVMTFDLITAVNNKLNASLNNIDNEFVVLYQGLKKFFNYNRGKLLEIEDRLDKVERNLKLERWNTTIRRRIFGDIEYRDLDAISKIVCLTRDFYEISKGEWSISDLQLLMDTMEKVGINPDDQINYFNAIKAISDNDVLTEKLLNGEKIQTINDPGFLISMSTLKKLEACRTEESYTVDAVSALLNESGVEKSRDTICAILTKKYLASQAFVNVDINVDVYDFILDLLYNLREAKEEGLLLTEVDTTQEDLNVDSEKADEKAYGQATALYVEARKYYEGTGVKKNLLKAYELFLQAAELGFADAQYYLAIMFAKGEEIEKDEKKALEWCQKSAEQGNVLAQNMMGDCYSSGFGGVEADEEKALVCYLKAANQGLAEAQFSAGSIFEEGCIINGKIQLDMEKAIEYYTKAADQGYPWAQYALGLLYRKGEGVKKDTQKAFELIMSAAKQGISPAECVLGEMYEQGKRKDYDEAAGWYLKAAKQGYTPAMYNLAKLYERGFDDDMDENEEDELALEWYRKAAEKGNASAQFYLGEIYFFGRLDEIEDEDEAKQWYLKAAKQGHREAKKKLKTYFDEVIDDNGEKGKIAVGLETNAIHNSSYASTAASVAGTVIAGPVGGVIGWGIAKLFK